MGEDKNWQLKRSDRARLASSFIGRNLSPILIASTFVSLGLFFIIDKFFESFLSEHEWIGYMFLVPPLLLFIVWTAGMAIEFFTFALEGYHEQRLRGETQKAAMIFVLVPALVIIAFLVFAMWASILG